MAALGHPLAPDEEALVVDMIEGAPTPPPPARQLNGS